MRKLERSLQKVKQYHQIIDKYKWRNQYLNLVHPLLDLNYVKSPVTLSNRKLLFNLANILEEIDFMSNSVIDFGDKVASWEKHDPQFQEICHKLERDNCY